MAQGNVVTAGRQVQLQRGAALLRQFDRFARGVEHLVDIAPRHGVDDQGAFLRLELFGTLFLQGDHARLRLGIDRGEHAAIGQCGRGRADRRQAGIGDGRVIGRAHVVGEHVGELLFVTLGRRDARFAQGKDVAGDIGGVVGTQWPLLQQAGDALLALLQGAGRIARQHALAHVASQ